MPAAGLALAVQRHCTSKLADGDLVRIATLGFRGEALPSIGAAARLTITSPRGGAAHASRISVAGGTVSAVAPPPGPPGTRVVVRGSVFRHAGPPQIPANRRAPRPTMPRRRCAAWRWPRPAWRCA